MTLFAGLYKDVALVYKSFASVERDL